MSGENETLQIGDAAEDVCVLCVRSHEAGAAGL